MEKLLQDIAAKKAQLDALERGPLADDLQPFQTFMHQRLDATLADYLGALEDGRAAPKP